jgi:hypothetical protein
VELPVRVADFGDDVSVPGPRPTPGLEVKASLSR